VIVLLALSMLVLAAIALRLAAPALRRRLVIWELRGDWWSRFERELNAYAADLRESGQRGSHHA
jgi:hypothetical protein